MEQRKTIKHALIAVSVFALSILFAQPSLAAAPARLVASEDYPRSKNEFAAARVIDAKTGKELYVYHQNTVRVAASLTKLMTALVFVDRKLPWEQIVSLKKTDEVGGGRLRLNPGSAMSIRDLFYSSLVASANNATIALSRISGISRASFVRSMNKRAAKIGMKDSVFKDPSGMDIGNLVTAHDMSLLAQVAFANPTIRKAVSVPDYTFKVRNATVVKELHSTNHLLWKDDLTVLAGKTGFLYESEYNFVTQLKPGAAMPDAPALTIVVLGAPTKEGSFESARTLAKWAWKAYSWPSP